MLSARNRVIRETAALRGYENLQTILRSKSQKHIGDDDPVLTKQDRRLLATNELYNTASRLYDANNLLQVCVSVLMDDGADTKQRKQMANNLKKLIVPLNEGAIVLLRNAAKDVAPMPGCDAHHKKCEVERIKVAKTEIKKPSKKARKVSIQMELIADFLKGMKPKSRKSPSDISSVPRVKRARMPAITPPNVNDDDEAEDVAIPLPANTTTMVYTKPEAVEILGQILL